MLRHVVLFQLKDSSSEEEIDRVVDAFRALPEKIPQIADFEYGVANSPEGLSGGLTHCFLVTFRSEADRDAYLPHPAHKAFVEVLKPHLEKVTVVDYFECRLHLRGLPTRSKIQDLHRYWFDTGIPLVIELGERAGRRR
jgi:hypothetical protein